MNKNYFLGIMLCVFVSICAMEQTQEPFPLMQLPDELLLQVICCAPPPLDEAITTLKALRLVDRRFRSLLTAKTDLCKVTHTLSHTCNVAYLKALEALALSLPACQELKSEWHKNTIEKLKITLEEKSQCKMQNVGVHLQRICWQPDGNLLLGVLCKETVFVSPSMQLLTIYGTLLMRLNRNESVDKNYIVALTEFRYVKNILPYEGFKRLEFITCPSNPTVCALFHEVILGTEKFQMVGKWENGQMADRSSISGNACDLPAHQIEWDGESVMFK